MYIQPERESDNGIFVPRNYSGNAFRMPHEEPPPPEQPFPTATEPPTTPLEREQPPTEPSADEKSVPASTFAPEKPQGLRGRFPFLASLLPPVRSNRKKGGALPEWALIGAVILLFLWEDEENDILPLLLLLLLWD